MLDPRPVSRLARLTGMAAALLLVLGPVSCTSYSPGGTGTSGDPETYESTVHFPQTISVVDTSSNETIWTMEVPVGQQLVVKFIDDFAKNNPTRPALMKWRVMPRGTTSGSLDNSIPVPDASSRRIDVKKTAIAATPKQ